MKDYTPTVFDEILESTQAVNEVSEQFIGWLDKKGNYIPMKAGDHSADLQRRYNNKYKKKLSWKKIFELAMEERLIRVLLTDLDEFVVEVWVSSTVNTITTAQMRAIKEYANNASSFYWEVAWIEDGDFEPEETDSGRDLRSFRQLVGI